MSIGKREYMLTFTDEYTREVCLYFLAKKSDAFVAYKQFEVWVSTHRQATVKVLRTDRGGEYMSHAFENHLSAQGTRHELTVHDSPSQNGVAERLNRMLVLHMRACMLASDLPKSLWAEALQYTAWTKNRTPTHTLVNKTPHEMATGVKPDLRDTHTWGSRVFVRVEGRGKLDVQADTAFFVGYDGQSKGYRVYWPGKRSVTCERNVR
jgi:transposase InsO family protein